MDARGGFLSLFAIGVCTDNLKFLALIIFSKDIFLKLVLIISNDLVCSAYYGFCTSIVLLKLKCFKIRVVFLEIKNVLNVGSAETVNALCIIAYHANILESCS